MASIRKIVMANVPILKKDDRAVDAAKILSGKPHGCVVVVDEDKSPIGIVTELDLLRKVISEGANPKIKLKEIMSKPVTAISPDTKMDEALKIIDTKHFRKYPVVSNNQVVGLVAERDVINSISYNVKFHRNLQNIVLMIFVLFELFIFFMYEKIYFALQV